MTQTSRPSLKRRALALYVDFLMFTAVLEPVRWAVRSAAIDSWLFAVFAFLGVRSLALLLRLTLPGHWALGFHPAADAGDLPRIRARERWWTMAAGALLILEGSKNAVRWTQGLPVEPLLGATASPGAAVAAITLIGALNIVAGILVLRTHAAGAITGIAMLSTEMVAAIVHRDAFRQWTADAVVARRALQGLPVRDGELEFMQAFTSVVAPAAMLLGINWLLAVASRFAAAGGTPPTADTSDSKTSTVRPARSA